MSNISTWAYHDVLCLSFFLLLLNFLAKCSSFSPKLSMICPPEETLALLQFKNTLEVCSFCDDNAKITTWVEGTDCCSWDGVTCDNSTGHVIGLDLSFSFLSGNITSNSTLFLLPYLQMLNLAYNDFMSSQIPPQFGSFPKLTHLNLSHSAFTGSIPPEISQLSRLVSLDLSFNNVSFVETHSFEKLIKNTTKLRVLDLSQINMSLIAPKSLMYLPSSLNSLRLLQCSIQGEVPDDLFLFPYLHVLDLSINPITGHFPMYNWSIPLKYLDLSSTDFSGVLPNSIGNLKSLQYLDLSNCKFHGSIPKEFGNLEQQLEFLSLSYNNLGGHIPHFFGNFSKLDTLRLEDNHFIGPFPISVFNITSLRELFLEDNHLEGPLPRCFPGGRSNLEIFFVRRNSLNGSVPSFLFTLPSLTDVELSFNKFTAIDPFQSSNLLEVNLMCNEIEGPIPSSIFELTNLTYINLSYNNFSGTHDWNLFQKRKNLFVLDLSHNAQLSFVVGNHVKFSLPSLKSIDLSSCNLSQWPAFLGTLEKLEGLDLSNNKLHGNISAEELVGWKSLISLNLSHNLLTKIEKHPWINIVDLDLSFNSLEGPLVLPPKFVDTFMISSNKLTGEIPSSICNISHAGALDLSNNGFHGVFPQCSVSFSYLSILDLQNNNFSGGIPREFPYNCSLQHLNLNGNNFEGPLPQSLANCRLNVLDVGNNKLNGTFPHWLEDLPDLKVLVLRANKLYGTIDHPMSTSPFSNLQILDLSQNEFSGILPLEYFQNFKYLMSADAVAKLQNKGSSNYYEYSIHKAYFPRYDIGYFLDGKVTDSISTAIDLSSNHFEGEIPEAIGKLKGLMMLNLSHNSLTGGIPSLICNLSFLLVLDLSYNGLTGQVPLCLGNFSDHLSVLDLRKNLFNGHIPTTFGRTSSGFNSLAYLNLNKNQFEGPLPPSLVNCSFLEVLDVANNNISDNFPHWLEPLPNLLILVLRSNNFHGSINNPKTNFSFQKLQILDLSHNNFTALVPSNFLQNLKYLMNKDDHQVKAKYVGQDRYSLAVVVNVKGLEIEMSRILNLFTTLDLSDNRFHGPIPETVGLLTSLLLMNFSRNGLEGRIPSSLANMITLESMDLSSNNLVGEIPQQLIALTFLAVLNLSYNQLSGLIPQGFQFNTFQDDSYIGNSGLCGLPLTVKCNEPELPQPPSTSIHEDGEDFTGWFDWKIAMMGYASGLVIGFSIGCIMLTTGKPRLFIKVVQEIYNRIARRPTRRQRQ